MVGKRLLGEYSAQLVFQLDGELFKQLFQRVAAQRDIIYCQSRDAGDEVATVAEQFNITILRLHGLRARLSCF